MENPTHVISASGNEVEIPSVISEAISQSNTHVLMIAPKSCVQCTATVRAFDKAGITHSKFLVDGSAKDPNPEQTDQIRDFMRNAGDGTTQMPFVIDLTKENLDSVWNGFLPDKIATINSVESVAS